MEKINCNLLLLFFWIKPNEVGFEESNAKIKKQIEEINYNINKNTIYCIVIINEDNLELKSNNYSLNSLLQLDQEIFTYKTLYAFLRNIFFVVNYNKSCIIINSHSMGFNIGNLEIAARAKEEEENKKIEKFISKISVTINDIPYPNDVINFKDSLRQFHKDHKKNYLFEFAHLLFEARFKAKNVKIKRFKGFSYISNKLDLLILNGCALGNYDNIYNLSSHFKYIIAPENEIDANNFDIIKILNSLENSEKNLENNCIDILNHYVNSKYNFTTVFSLINSKKIFEFNIYLNLLIDNEQYNTSLQKSISKLKILESNAISSSLLKIGVVDLFYLINTLDNEHKANMLKLLDNIMINKTGFSSNTFNYGLSIYAPLIILSNPEYIKYLGLLIYFKMNYREKLKLRSSYNWDNFILSQFNLDSIEKINQIN